MSPFVPSEIISLLVTDTVDIFRSLLISPSGRISDSKPYTTTAGLKSYSDCSPKLN